MRFILVATMILSSYQLQAQRAKANNQTEHTFEVDKVVAAKKLLPEKNIQAAVEYKTERAVKRIPSSHQNLSIVPTQNNALIQTVQICYDEHRPLKLSPDAIWLAICQGVSIHINQNFTSLKTLLFKDSSISKIELRKREDSLSFKNDSWQIALKKISQAANEHLKADYYQFFVPQFSTTTPINKTVSEITMLEAFKQQFIYVGETGCGIPKITITGTPSDWQWIYSNLSMLNQLGLQEWSDELKPIIQQFINVSSGNVDISFWQNIYKNATEYNAYYLSGWFIKFFPYLVETGELYITDTVGSGLAKVDLLYKPNPYLYKDDYLKSTLSTNDFPSGVANIDFIRENYNTIKTTHLQCFAGFMGIQQDKNKTLEPFISWAITDTNVVNFYKERKTYPERLFDAKHKQDYWSPNFARKITNSAVFDIKRFKTTEASLKYIRQIILDSLQKSQLFDNTTYKCKKIAIEIFSNGNSGSVYLIHPPKIEEPIKNQDAEDTSSKYIVYKASSVSFKKNNKENNELFYIANATTEEFNSNHYEDGKPSRLELYIKHILDSQKEKWFPSLAHPVDILEINDASENEKKLKVKANSLVIIRL